MKNSRIKETIQDCLRNRNFMIGLIMILSVCLIAIFANEISHKTSRRRKDGSSECKVFIRYR